MIDIQVLTTPTFRKTFKKMHNREQDQVKKAIKQIVANPESGVQKKGELNDVFVYKFKIDQQLTLLAYQFDPETRTLLMLGSHQNFYRNLKHLVK